VKVGAIILSRLDSRRLPGKALRKVAGRPLIDYVLGFCRRIDGVSVIVLATTDRALDDPLAAYADEVGIPCVRGAVDDVAGRFLSAMECYKLDAALRINGDSPLNDAMLLGQGLQLFLQEDVDLVSNVPQRTFPFGMSLEVVKREAMERAYLMMDKEDHKEHVTKYFYDNPEIFTIKTVSSKHSFFSRVQLAVDTKEDLDRVEWIVSRLECDPAEAKAEHIVDLAIRSPMCAKCEHD